MRTRTLILLIVALVLAGGTTMMARVWLSAQRMTGQEAAPIAVPTPSKSVLIVRSSIQRGQILRPDDLAWEPWPEGGIAKNYVVLGTRTPETYNGWVAKRPIADFDAYADQLGRFVFRSGFIMKPVFAKAKAASRSVIYAEGEDERVLRATQVILEERIARPILIGRPDVVKERIKRFGLAMTPDGKGFYYVEDDMNTLMIAQ